MSELLKKARSPWGTGISPGALAFHEALEALRKKLRHAHHPT